MGSMSIWHWLIVLVVVLVVFGTKKLRNAGGDVGAAVKNFKDAMREGEDQVNTRPPAVSTQAPITPAQPADSRKDQV